MNDICRQKKTCLTNLIVVFFIKYNVRVFFLPCLLRHAVTAKDCRPQVLCFFFFLNQISLKTKHRFFVIQVGKIVVFTKPSLFFFARLHRDKLKGE